MVVVPSNLSTISGRSSVSRRAARWRSQSYSTSIEGEMLKALVVLGQQALVDQLLRQAGAAWQVVGFHD